MKRRVSFLLMLVIAIALTFALSSCGDCKHKETRTEHETTTEANCMVVEKYDEVVYCVDCKEELSRTSKKGQLGDHVLGEPVFENIDVLDCTQGGKADKVVYCTVPRCEYVHSREQDVVVNKAEAHSLSTQKIYDENHTQYRTLTYCTECTYQAFSAPKVDLKGPDHVYNNKGTVPKNGGICTLCFSVLGDADRLEYTLNEDGNSYTLTGVKGDSKLGTYLYVGEYKGKPVTKIAPKAFERNQEIRFVVIGDCVKEIGANAFNGCKLKKVYTYDLQAWCNIKFENPTANPIAVAETFSPNKIDVKSAFVIPSNITSISDYAFTNLKASTLYIPANVQNISANAFANCDTLVNVRLADTTASSRTFGADVFKGCDNIRNVYADSVLGWLKNSFVTAESNPVFVADSLYVTGIEAPVNTGAFEIPNGVEVINNYAFINFDITSLKIPDSVTHIGTFAFSGCTNLAAVDLGKGLTTIEHAAFAHCSAITSIVIPDSVTTIGDAAFFNCPGIATLTIGNNVSFIGISAFEGCASITAVKIPAVLTSLSARVFANCTKLTTVELNGILHTIGGSAFVNCVSIVDFGFTENIQTIDGHAFAGCVSLSKLNFNANLKTIGAGAFKDCKSITAITISDNVDEIGLGAFEGCSSVENITIPFIGNKKDSDENAHFGFIFGAPENWLLDENGEKVELLAPDNRSYVPYTLANVVINGEAVLKANAFAGCDSIVTVKLPATLVAVEENAFAECTSLSAVYFPNLEKWCRIAFETYVSNPLAYANELYIDANADGNYTADELLKTLTVPAAITEILPYTFYGASEISEIVIHGGVQSIGKSAFAHCTALSKVTVLENSVLSNVGSLAFAGCESIESVAIAAVSDWCRIEFGDIFANPLYYADSLCVAGSALTDLVVPAGIYGVNSYAFANCDFLASITISEGLQFIGSYSFYDCDNANLKAVTLPSTMMSVLFSAFESCDNLESVGLGNVVAIGDRAFADCASLKAIAIPDTTILISNEAFSGCENVTTLTLGAALDEIGISAFYGCESITSLTVPASVKRIGAHAFSECDALASVTFAAATGWVANGVAVDGLTDAAASAAKLNALSSVEWVRA